nr:RNA-directed DNA polymerase, eukaryota [Tanacetum cinerariifolium]
MASPLDSSNDSGIFLNLISRRSFPHSLILKRCRWVLILHSYPETNRLAKVVDKIVSHEQSAFISGRQILDGPLMLSEMIDWYKKRKKKRCPFLKLILKKPSIRTSILVNGSPTSKFSAKRGLRQRDPMSPFLFILVFFYLASGLKINIQKSNVYGVGVSDNEILLDRFDARSFKWKANVLSIGGIILLG